MDVRVVGLKVEDKKHAQEAWKTLHERHEAGVTDYVEVLGLWKNKRGKVHAESTATTIASSARSWVSTSA